MGCHFLLQFIKVKSESEVAQSCPTHSDPMDYSLPSSSIHGIFQARVLEWVAIAFSGIVYRVTMKNEIAMIESQAHFIPSFWPNNLFLPFFFFLVWTILKSLLNVFTILFLCYVLIFGPQGMWDLSSPIRIKLALSALESEVLTTGPQGSPWLKNLLAG